jgi:hypothetical protein
MRRSILLACLAAPLALADPQLGRDPAIPATLPTPVRAYGDCVLSPKERAFADHLLGDPRQRRPRLVCDRRLMDFARARAADMAARGYFAHVTPENVGPNSALRAAGYALPPTYAHGRANNVEAIAADIADPAELWRMFVASDDHRMHLLAEHAFYEVQDEFGIAHLYAPASELKDYWVVIVARRARDDDWGAYCEPPPGACTTR